MSMPAQPAVDLCGDDIEGVRMDEGDRKRRNRTRWIVALCSATALAIYIWMYVQAALA